MAGARPVLLLKNTLPPFSQGLCKEGKFGDTGGCQLVAHGPKLAHRCILFHLPGFNKFKSTCQKFGIFHIQILGFWFYLEQPGSFFFSFSFFLTVLGLCYFVRVFSSCSKQGLATLRCSGWAHFGGFSCAERRL